MTFQQRLTELLAENKINYNFLAKQTGIPVTTISNYINRGSHPTVIQLIILADYFKCSIDFLVGREDDFGNVTTLEKNNLSTKEQNLLNIFRNLSNEKQDKLLQDANSYFDMNKN